MAEPRRLIIHFTDGTKKLLEFPQQLADADATLAARLKEALEARHLVIEADGRGFRVVEDPGGAARTVYGPVILVDAVVAEANTIIRFSPRGFAVPAGTITVRSGGEVRRVIVSLLGRVRIASGEPPS